MERKIESILKKFKSVFGFNPKPKDPFFADRSVYRSSDLLRIKSLYEALPNHGIAGEIIASEWAQIVIIPRNYFMDFRFRDPLLTLKMLYDNLAVDRSSEALRFLSKAIADYMGFSPNFTFYNFE